MTAYVIGAIAILVGVFLVWMSLHVESHCSRWQYRHLGNLLSVGYGLGLLLILAGALTIVMSALR